MAAACNDTARREDRAGQLVSADTVRLLLQGSYGVILIQLLYSTSLQFSS
jgi:hypothetical protein